MGLLDQQYHGSRDHELDQYHHMRSVGHRHLEPPEHRLSHHHQGSTGYPGVALAALKLRLRAKLNTETYFKSRRAHTLTVGERRPRANPLAASLRFAKGGRYPLLTSTGFVSPQSTSGFVFFFFGLRAYRYRGIDADTSPIINSGGGAAPKAELQ